MERNIVGWFEIPVKDMDRAIQFYEAVFDIKLERHPMPEMDMAWFPMEDAPGSPGSLVKHEAYRPSEEGVLVYFTSPSGDLGKELARVEAAGGKVILDKNKISEEHGFMAVILDSEGNRVALHSRG